MPKISEVSLAAIKRAADLNKEAVDVNPRLRASMFLAAAIMAAAENPKLPPHFMAEVFTAAGREDLVRMANKAQAYVIAGEEIGKYAKTLANDLFLNIDKWSDDEPPPVL